MKINNLNYYIKDYFIWVIFPYDIKAKILNIIYQKNECEKKLCYFIIDKSPNQRYEYYWDCDGGITRETNNIPQKSYRKYLNFIGFINEINKINEKEFNKINESEHIYNSLCFINRKNNKVSSIFSEIMRDNKSVSVFDIIKTIDYLKTNSLIKQINVENITGDEYYVLTDVGKNYLGDLKLFYKIKQMKIFTILTLFVSLFGLYVTIKK